MNGDDKRVTSLTKGLFAEEGVVGRMENVEGLTVVEPSEVLAANSVRDAVRAETSIFLKGEVRMSRVVKFVGAVGGGQSGVNILGKAIDDISEVAVDASGGLRCIDLTIVKNFHGDSPISWRRKEQLLNSLYIDSILYHFDHNSE